MISRRPEYRLNRGRIQQQGGGSSVSPLTIITSVAVLQWVRGDIGITIGTGVSAWADQSGNGHDFAQGTGGAQPAYSASDGTLNGRPSVTGDGVDDTLLNSTMPNGNGNWMSCIAKTVVWVNNRCLFGSNAAPECGDILTLTGTPRLGMYNGTATRNSNTGLTAGSWGRLEAHYAAAASYLKLRGTTVADGLTPGVATSTGCALFSTIGAAFGNFAIGERVVCSGKPTAGEIAALEAYYVNLYTQANVE